MKRIVLLALACFFFACKKDMSSGNEDITKVKWVLETANSSIPLPYNNSTTTDYIAIQGPFSCLGSNYTLTFSEDGTYQFSSTGALCDMFGQDKNQKWIRNGSTITLKGFWNSDLLVTVNGDTLTYTIANTPGVIYWNVLYTFKAKSK